MLATTLLIRVVQNIDFWRGNYRDKDMPRYDLTIAIFDTIRYIVPSLLRIVQYYEDEIFRFLASACAVIKVMALMKFEPCPVIWFDAVSDIDLFLCRFASISYAAYVHMTCSPILVPIWVLAPSCTTRASRGSKSTCLFISINRRVLTHSVGIGYICHL